MDRKNRIAYAVAATGVIGALAVLSSVTERNIPDVRLLPNGARVVDLNRDKSSDLYIPKSSGLPMLYARGSERLAREAGYTLDYLPGTPPSSTPREMPEEFREALDKIFSN